MLFISEFLLCYVLWRVYKDLISLLMSVAHIMFQNVIQTYYTADHTFSSCTWMQNRRALIVSTDTINMLMLDTGYQLTCSLINTSYLSTAVSNIMFITVLLLTTVFWGKFCTVMKSDFQLRHVCLSACINLAPTGRIFIKFYTKLLENPDSSLLYCTI